MTKTTTKKQPSAQVAPAKRAAALKAANEVKRPQPPWLRSKSLAKPSPNDNAPSASKKRKRKSDKPRDLPAPLLIGRGQVCALADTSYPSLWQWMRDGRFPRSRIVGGRSMWLVSEIEDWLA